MQNNTEKYPCCLLAGNILNLNQAAWELISPARQKDILGKVIKKITWDGRNAIIYLQPGEVLQENPGTDADKGSADKEGQIKVM